MTRAVFLDRDGVILDELGFLRRPEDMRLYPGAGRAVAALNRAGLKVIVASNQSGVGRGYFTRSMLGRIHRELRRRLRQDGARLDAIYYCPHRPGPREPLRQRCRCRKPQTGMLERAARRFGLKLKDCVMIGDSTSDLKTARNAGCGAVLVRTGRAGRDGLFKVRPDAVCRDLAAAARWVMRRA